MIYQAQGLPDLGTVLDGTKCESGMVSSQLCLLNNLFSFNLGQGYTASNRYSMSNVHFAILVVTIANSTWIQK